MKIILIYLLIISYWAEMVLGFELTTIPGLSFLNIILYIFIIIWLLSILKRKATTRHHKVYKYFIMMFIVMLFAIIVKKLKNQIPNVNVLEEVIWIKGWLNPFIIFVVLFNMIDNRETCNKAIFGLIMLLIVTVVGQILGAFEIINYDAATLARRGRAAGMGDINDYASFLVLFIPLLISSFLFKKDIRLKLFYGSLLCFSMVGLIITGSRGGVLSFFFSMLVLSFLLVKEKFIKLSRIFLIGTFFILISFSSFLILPSHVTEGYKVRFDPTQVRDINDFTSSRLFLWTNGLLFFLESPLYGHGNNSYLPLLIQKFKKRGVAHNQYLEHAVSYGIIGLFIYLMIHITIIKFVINNLRVAKEVWSKQLYISYLSGLGGYLFALLNINRGISGYPLWIFTAIICSHCYFNSIDNVKLK